MSKKNFIFLFTHCSFPPCVSFTIFSYSLYFSLLFYLLSLMQFFKTALSSLSLAGTSPLFSTPNAQMAFPFYFFHLFFFFLPHSSHQITTNASNLTLTLLQPKSLSPALIGRMAFACFFSFFFSVSNTLWLTFC